jgi:hypothetical protein
VSLTSFLSRNSDVKERFRHEFTKPKLTAIERQTKMLAPPMSNQYALIGTAFDYLLRFYLQYTNPTAKKDSWVADLAVDILRKQAALGRIDKSVYRKGESIVTEAKGRLSRYLITGQIHEELIESTLLLAQLDSVFRQGIGHEQIGTVSKEDLQDLNNLISIVPSTLFKSQHRCLLNPTFGIASEIVGGADADFIIDDLLVDIKTTKYLELKEEYFHQLLGYYVLFAIEESYEKEAYEKELLREIPRDVKCEETEHNRKINKVAIYFSRHAYLKILHLDDYINNNTFPEFMRWFEKRARKEFRK